MLDYNPLTTTTMNISNNFNAIDTHGQWAITIVDYIRLHSDHRNDNWQVLVSNQNMFEGKINYGVLLLLQNHYRDFQ